MYTNRSRNCRNLIVWLVVSFLFVAASKSFERPVVEDSNAVKKWMKEFNDTFSSNPEYGLKLSLKIIATSEEIGYKAGIAKGYMAEGGLYEKMGNFVKATEYLQKAVTVSREFQMQKVEWAALSSLGVISAEKSDQNKAFAYFTEALNISKALNDTPKMAICYLYIGNVLTEKENYEEGIKAYNTAAALYKSQNRPRDFGHLYYNIAVLYVENKKFAQALPYIQQAIDVYRKLDDSANLCFPYDLLGTYFLSGKKYDSAIFYATLSSAIAGKVGDRREQATALYNLGSVYDSLGEFSTAEIHYKKALLLSRDVSFKKHYYSIPRSLARIYAKMHSYQNAYECLDTAYVSRDSLLTEEKEKAMAEMQVRFDVKELDDKNKLLQKENDLKQVRLQRKNVLVYAGFGAAILFLVIGVQVVRQNRLKANQQKMELEQKQLLAQINPHFIFNCLNSIQQFVVQNDTMNANKYLADFAMLMRQTLDNSKDGTISLRREMEYLENYLSFEHMRFEDKFSYSIQCAPEINADTSEIPSMIIQPFVENAIRHGLCNLEEKKGVLKIYFYKKESYLCCEVDDNGIGMEEAKKLKEQTFIKYQSHGMDLTQKRLALVSKMQSKDYNITVINKSDDKNASGTTIIIKFPFQA